MLHIIGIMLLGVLIGYRFRHREITQKTEKTISMTIVALLFILGLSIGSNQGVVSNLYEYSSQALVLALFGLGGSILFSGVVYKIFFQEGGEK